MRSVARPTLPPLPDGLTATREALHQLAFYVLSPVRREATGRIGLCWIEGGFGTPPFGPDDTRLRVDGIDLVVETAGAVRREPITTLARAGALVGRAPVAADRGEFDVPVMVDPDTPLPVDPESVAFLDAWFGFSTTVLELLRELHASGEPSPVQLWPEHFDVALDVASAPGGTRATCGMSPGDDAHEAPYVYVAPWAPVDRAEPWWNDLAFNGASLAFAELARASDAYAAASSFLQRGLERISPGARR